MARVFFCQRNGKEAEEFCLFVQTLHLKENSSMFLRAVRKRCVEGLFVSFVTFFELKFEVEKIVPIY